MLTSGQVHHMGCSTGSLNLQPTIIISISYTKILCPSIGGSICNSKACAELTNNHLQCFQNVEKSIDTSPEATSYFSREYSFQ